MCGPSSLFPWRCRCQVAGDHFGINADTDFDLNYTSVFDLFEEAGVTYKGYMEAYPGELCI